MKQLTMLIMVLAITAQGYSRGLLRDPKKFAEFKKSARHISATKYEGEIPDKASVSQFVSISNQKSCGACWDFSLTGTLHTSLKAHGKPVPDAEPGWNYLLGCSPYGCGGGDFDAAAWLTTKGQKGYWKNSDFPYTARNVKCKSFPVIGTSPKYAMLGTKTSNPSFKDIAYAIGVLKLAVSVDVAATGRWSNYEEGIYSNSASGRINHMVMITGYDCEGKCEFDAKGELPKGKGFVEVANSWGKKWGTEVAGQGGFMLSRLHANRLGEDALIFDIPAWE